MSKNDKKKNKGSLKGNVDTKKREHVDVQKKNINIIKKENPNKKIYIDIELFDKILNSTEKVANVLE